MYVGLYIAAQGMLAEQVRQDQLASDLSNSSTPGYEPDTAIQSSFGALLMNNQAGQSIGSINTGVKISGQVTSTTPLPMNATGNPLDFAIAGTGMFGVRTANGVEYTRNGQFSANAQGLLVDQFGNEVVSQSGAPIRVGPQGTVPPTALGVFNIANPTKLGNNNFSGRPSGGATGTVETGHLEGSGVDPIETMVGMTASLQAYQAGQKAIQTINQTMQESAGTVGLVSGVG